MPTFLQVILSVLTLAGSLGIFLYGMKMLSEALQKVAGDRMRDLLAAMTSNTFKRILTGLVVTMVVQSSSATTVMVVSFVNAGLLSLLQAVGVIMGANIGTTFTAWIIAMLGFEVDLSAVTLPLIGIAVPLLFSKKNSHRSIGELILGFCMIFLGLKFLQDSVPDLSQYPSVLEFLARFSGYGLWSVLLFVFIGILLTVVVQSSAATMALTLIMCSNGWIDFPMAAAMVLGENVGTTITALLAAAVGNISAKRTALFHVIFNVIGVIWALLIFTPTLHLVDRLAQRGGLESPWVSTTAIPIALSLFHTFFNVVNTLILVWFTPQLVRLVKFILPAKENEDEAFRLRQMRVGLVSTGELSLLQAKKETITFAHRTYRMFGFVRSMLEPVSQKELKVLYERVAKYEDISDRVEVEIATYLGQVRTSRISEEGSEILQALMKIISDIESIADYCHNTAKIIMRRQQENIFFNEHITANINRMLDLVDSAFGIMEANLSGPFTGRLDLSQAYECEDRINQFRNQLKSEHIGNVEQGVYSYHAGILYDDIISQCERMGDSLINISEDIAEIKVQVKGLECDALNAAIGDKAS